MPKAHFRFYAELNDLLPPGRRQVQFSHAFELSPSIKDLIESLGVPHTEIDLILVNGESTDLDYQVQDGDRISVYPVFESFDITSLTRVRPAPLRQTQFVLDTHLGKLATYLRMFGFDALYRNDYADARLAQISRQQERILLTRDHGLLKRALVTHGYYVRSEDPKEQIIEILRRFDLWHSIRPLSRCLRCNGLLEPVSKADVLDEIPARTRLYYDAFSRCTHCQRIYWRGSHFERMIRFVEQTMGAAAGEVVSSESSSPCLSGAGEV
ncbi:MAG: Mut7-C ubiquitin/RNAse domain-containing protein [Anaerolineae bacterium]|nr:Mut7-C ubiquitin/RNAse domain-containing protein [Anaerolineae bacterium]